MALFAGMTSAFTRDTAAFESGGLRRFFENKEYFFTDAVNSRTLRAAEGVFVQKKFDSLGRLIQKSVWKESMAEPLSLTDYSYAEDSPYPKTAVTSDNEKERIIHESFTDEGLPLKREIYVPGAEKKSRLFSTETFRYDDNKRIIEERIEYSDYAQKDEKPLQKGRQSEKKEYRYAEGRSRADEFYYRGADKIRQRIYSSDSDWEETVFFPDGVRILTRYKNEMPVLETIYENGVKKRERSL
ncbi:hypothetical protein V1L52_08870 [Treponema sp. HNW]|uniref:hypothetical protein n=1 Tax=Treponema sp. HNW TaxID=3116654 RepID=UPI003D13AE04